VNDRFFLDTFWVQAVLNRTDTYHLAAVRWLPRVEAAQVWTTEAVLTEIGNALSALARPQAADFIARCYATPSIHVVTVSTALFERALALYTARSDKQWGLTDCISFVVMEDENLRDALTGDRHFVQAGFNALL
jgi:hypothetical protein